MRKLIVHIGTAKTGTTSIQRFLRANRRALARRGYVVPKSMGRSRHDALSIMGLSENPILLVHRRLNLSDAADVAAFKKRATAALEADLARAPQDAVVLLTSEDLSTLLLTAEDVDRFATWVRAFAPDPEILVYLRRQDTMFVAAYSTAIKSGSTNPFTFPTMTQPIGATTRLNYAALLDRWAGAFGRDAITARIFDRGSLVNRDVVHDFLAGVGLTDTEGLRFPAAANPSLDRDALEFLRLMNAHIPALIDGRRNPLRGRLAPLLGRMPSMSGPFRVDPAEARAFVAQFSDVNAEVARKYLGRADGILFGDDFGDPQPGEAGQTDLTVERVVEMSAQLWMAQQNQINSLRAPAESASTDADEDGDDEG